MKKFLCISFSISLFLGLFSCENQQRETSSNARIIQIDPDDMGVKRLSEIFELGEVIHLEAREGSYLSRMDKFSIHDSLIVVLDMDKVNMVLVFNTDGTFKYNSGDHGKGPFELIFPCDYCVRDDFLYILGEQGKVVKYRLSTGEPIEEYFPGLGAYQLSAIDDETFIISDLKYHDLVIYDNDFKELVRFKKSSWFKFINTFKPFEQDGKKVLFTDRMSDTIFSVSKSGMKPEYIFDFGSSGITQNHISKCESIDELMRMCSLQELCFWFADFSKWGNRIYIRYRKGDTSFRSISDLKSGQNIIYSLKTEDDILGLPYSPGFQYIDSTGFYFSSNVLDIDKSADPRLEHYDENSNPVVFSYRLR